MIADSTRQLVAEMKSTRRDTTVGASCAAAAAILGFVLLVSLAGDALGEPRPIVIVPENVDLVAYRLPTTCTLTELSQHLWHDEVSATELLRYNRTVADVVTPLTAGTVLTVPNFRDFPVEELSL